jgi:hypothetical protein
MDHVRFALGLLSEPRDVSGGERRGEKAASQRAEKRSPVHY